MFKSLIDELLMRGRTAKAVRLAHALYPQDILSNEEDESAKNKSLRDTDKAEAHNTWLCIARRAMALLDIDTAIQAYSAMGDGRTALELTHVLQAGADSGDVAFLRSHVSSILDDESSAMKHLTRSVAMHVNEKEERVVTVQEEALQLACALRKV
ncbi:MAG: hypothetical protein MHM6MM_002230 [Cercozoa sp. M6MM]